MGTALRSPRATARTAHHDEQDGRLHEDEIQVEYGVQADVDVPRVHVGEKGDDRIAARPAIRIPRRLSLK
jgi:hypothetical protein